ncbi:hypothetical protein [Streptosporangium sp. NPDC087985]|uniref:hypothetical protein n=1 Tax=Streptosporangium sp. NPDC087985 TaxID=3366196 RepID=UPI0038113644
MGWVLLIVGAVLFILSGPLTGEFLKRSRGEIPENGPYRPGEVPKLVSLMNLGGLALAGVGILVLIFG